MMSQTIEESSLDTPEQIMTSPIMLVHAAQIGVTFRDNKYTDIWMRTLDIPDCLTFTSCVHKSNYNIIQYLNSKRSRIALT